MKINLTLHKANADTAATIYADTAARYGVDANISRVRFRTLAIENAKAGKAAQDQAAYNANLLAVWNSAGSLDPETGRRLKSALARGLTGAA